MLFCKSFYPDTCLSILETFRRVSQLLCEYSTWLLHCFPPKVSDSEGRVGSGARRLVGGDAGHYLLLQSLSLVIDNQS